MKPNLNTYVIVGCAVLIALWLYFRPDGAHVIDEKEKEIAALTDTIKQVRLERAAIEDTIKSIRTEFVYVSHLRDSMSNAVIKALAKYKGVKTQTKKEQDDFEKLSLDETSEYILKKISQ